MRNPLSKQFRDKLRPMFYSIGLTVALGTTVVAFQWKMETPRLIISEEGTIVDETSIIPNTYPKEPERAKSEKKKESKSKKSSVFELLDDDTPLELPDDDNFSSDDTAVIDVPSIPESDVLIDVTSVQFVPYFKDCGELFSEKDRMNCLNSGIANHIKKNFKAQAYYRDIPTIWVTFTVKSDGSIKDVSVIRGGNTDMNAEAVRVIKGISGLNPGKHNGRAVNTRFTIPIRVN